MLKTKYRSVIPGATTREIRAGEGLRSFVGKDSGNRSFITLPRSNWRSKEEHLADLAKLRGFVDEGIKVFYISHFDITGDGVFERMYRAHMQSLRDRLARVGLMFRHDVITKEAFPAGPLVERIDLVEYLRETNPDTLMEWLVQSLPEIAPYIANFAEYAEEQSRAYSRTGILDTADQIIVKSFRQLVPMTMQKGTYENAIFAGPYGLIDLGVDELEDKGVEFDSYSRSTD
jgi:hypothetical protein